MVSGTFMVSSRCRTIPRYCARACFAGNPDRGQFTAASSGSRLCQHQTDADSEDTSRFPHQPVAAARAHRDAAAGLRRHGGGARRGTLRARARRPRQARPHQARPVARPGSPTARPRPRRCPLRAARRPLWRAARSSRPTTSGIPTSPSCRWKAQRRLAAQHELGLDLPHPDFGPSGGYPYGIPYTVVTSSHPLVDVSFTYASERKLDGIKV
jgi:hypothetical protein